MKKILALIVVMSMIVSTGITEVHGNVGNATDKLKDKTISELRNSGAITYIQKYNVPDEDGNYKIYKAYRVEEKVGKLYPYALFTDENNYLVNDEKVLDRLYDMYYLFNVLEPEKALDVIIEFDNTKDLFKEYVLIEGWSKALGAGGAAYISPSMWVNIVTDTGKDYLIDPQKIIRAAISTNFMSQRDKLIKLNDYIKQWNDKSKIDYNEDMIEIAMELVPELQGTVDFLVNDMYETVEDGAWYTTIIMALKSMGDSVTWDSVKLKPADKKNMDEIVLILKNIELIIDQEKYAKEKAPEVIISYIAEDEDKEEQLNGMFKNLTKLFSGLTSVIAMNEYIDQRTNMNNEFVENVKTVSLNKAVKPSDEYTVKIEGKYVYFDKSSGVPKVINNRTMVPVRRLFETAGLKVEWINSTQTVVISNHIAKLKVPIGYNKFEYSEYYNRKNNKTLESDVVPVVIDGRTYLPVRLIMEAFGYEVDWDGNNKTVLID